MLTLDLVGQAILVVDAVGLTWAAWRSWRLGRSDVGTLTRPAAAVASLGFAAIAAIVVYALMQ